MMDDELYIQSYVTQWTPQLFLLSVQEANHHHKQL